MQLSASNLPLDSNPILPAGTASAPPSGCGVTDAPAEPGAFGALLTAASAADGAAVDESANEKKPSPTPDDTAPNPDALASWLAANGFTPAAPPPTPVPTQDVGGEVPLTDDAVTTGETPVTESSNTPGGVGEGATTSGRSAAELTRLGGRVRGSQVRAAYARLPASTSARIPSADSAMPSPDGAAEIAATAARENEGENPALTANAGVSAPSVSADAAANATALAASIDSLSQSPRRVPAVVAGDAEASQPSNAKNLTSLRVPSSPANGLPQPVATVGDSTMRASEFSLPPTVAVSAAQADSAVQPHVSVTAVAADAQTLAVTETPDSTPPSAGKMSAQGADSSKSGVTLLGISTSANDAREKIAAAPERLAAMSATLEKFGIKKSLSTEEQGIAERPAGLGINAAKSRDAMPALAVTPVRPPTDDSPSSSFSIPSLDFTAIVKEQPPQPPSELASAARRTVESVLAVTDHFTTTGGQHGVNLKFSVSGIDLDVRVEVKGGSVQTTFRTDSPELRAALASEWRAVATGSPDRSERLAEPVFTSSSGRDAFQSDAGTADQRGARQGQPLFGETATPRAALRRPVTVTTVVAPTPLASISTAGRLHTFA